MVRLARVSFFGFLALTWSLVPARAEVGEKDLYDAFSKVVTGSPSTKEGLTAMDRKALFTQAVNNPVANVEMLFKYDPKGIVGFCFGRAMTVHLIARRMGLKDSSLRKLFIIG